MTDVARTRFQALVEKLRRALEYAYVDTGHGAFVRGTSIERRHTEYVPSPFMALDELSALLVQEAPQEKAQRELQGGHTRLNECAGWEKTKDLPLYDRISLKIQELSEAKREVEHMLKASGHEMDILRSRAEAAEHRRAAAEYRAQRIVLDAELLKRAEVAEAELAKLRANFVVPEAESGSTPLRTLLRRVHEWNDSDELDAIPVMADVEETLIHVLEKAALPESGPAGAKLREQIGSYVDGMCASPVTDTRRIARQLISFLNAYDAAALLVPAAPQDKP